MGGNHKQAQRTKNNARPSSSGRSAELLGSSIPQFVGFAGMKETGLSMFSLSTSTSADDPTSADSTIDTNFQLTLKKMNKKDATTKLKALQEFTELVVQSESEAVKAVLAFWPRLYAQLATDFDHRVREAAQTAHHQLVLKAKRNIAPHLKKLIGPWFTAQYDTYAPAASAAVHAFEATFPPNKIEDAIVFCQVEILNYIGDNLTVHTAQSLCNLKTVSQEDAEARYERVVISSLQGYSLYLDKVPFEQIQLVAELNRKIVVHAQFWKFAKHKLASIRATWFAVVSKLCQKAAFLLESERTHLIATVFNSLNESDPMVLPNVWEAALLIMSSIKDWWTFISVEKVFLSKLWKALREGGHGNAAIIYPNLLPLLSNLPPTIDTKNFYGTFFNNLRSGLNQKSVLASRSEVTAVVTSLIECLQYVILKNQHDINLCEKLIETQLFALIDWSLMEDHACYKTVFNQIALIVQYWSRNTSSDYTTFLTFFWTTLETSMRSILIKSTSSMCGGDRNKLLHLAERQIDLLQSLKHTAKPKKKQMKVKFSSSTELLSGTDKVDSLSLHSLLDQSYFVALNSFACNMCELFINEINEKQSKELLDHLISLLKSFESRDFLVNLSRLVRKSAKDQVEDESISNLYHNVFEKWLKSHYLCSKAVVDLIFLLLKYLSLDENQQIFDSFLQISNDECLGWCLSEAFSDPHNKNPLIRKWLCNDKITKYIISIADREISDDCPAELSVLFKLAFTENEDGDLLISKEAVIEIISKFKAALLNPNDYLLTIDSCSSLASYISTIIYTDHLLLEYGDDLLLALFTLFCNSSTIDSEILSKDTVWEVSTSWQDVIITLSKRLDANAFNNIAMKFASIVEMKFLSYSLSDDNIDNLVDAIVKFIQATLKNRPLIGADLCKLFFDRSFIPKWKNDVVGICRLYEFLNDGLCCPYNELLSKQQCRNDDDDKQIIMINDVDIVKYFVWSLVKISILTSTINDDDDDDNNVDDDDDDDEVDDDNVVVASMILDTIDDNCALIVDCLYDLGIASSLLENYKMTKYYSDLEHHYNSIKDLTKSLLINNNNMLDIRNVDKKMELKSMLMRKVKSNTENDDDDDGGAWLWCKTVYIFYSDICPQRLDDIYDEFVRNNNTNNLAFLHLTQLFGKHLSYDNVTNYLKKDIAVDSMIILKSLVHCEEIDVQIAEVFGKIDRIRNENMPLFMYENPKICWKKSQEIVETIRVCSKLILYKFHVLGRRHWDFIVIALISWTSNCVKMRNSLKNYDIQSFMIALSDLFSNVDNAIKSLKINDPKNSFINEWEDLFLPSIHTSIVQIWLFLAEQFENSQQCLPITYLPLLQNYGAVINNFNNEFIFKNNDGSLPKWSKFLKRCCSLLLSPIVTLQLWGHQMLHVLVPGLVEIDTMAVNTNTPHEKGLIFEQFKEVLVRSHEIVHVMLQGFKLGEDSCTVEPFTDSYTYTLAYLLIWDVLLVLCEKSSTELRFQYADWLRKEDLLKNLLNNLFRLMPAEILFLSGENTSSLKLYAPLFLTRLDLSTMKSGGSTTTTTIISSDKLEHLVCSVYALSLSQLPALVRQWWSSTEPRVAQIVEKVTATYLSPQMCSQELSDVALHETKFKNMVIKVVPSVREVIAIYTVDEAQMELVITLPTNYPLAGPVVQCNRQIGGTSHKQWLMQLKKCVLHQNGRIWDGLSLWNSNLDKKFDGVEECYICFAVLHPGTYQLPKLSCQICKKKFHSACLYKWFSTSNKSSCPICRNLF